MWASTESESGRATSSDVSGRNSSRSASRLIAVLIACERCDGQRLDCLHANRDFELGIVGVHFFPAQFFGRQTIKKRGCRKNIPVALHAYLIARERFLKQPAGRHRGEPPVVAPPLHIRSARFRDSSTGREHDSPRL